MRTRTDVRLARLLVVAASVLAVAVAAQAAHAAFPGFNGRIAFVRDGSIYTSSTTGGCERLLTRGLAPAWSPDGTKVAFIRDGDVYTINADGSGEHRLTSDGEAASGHTWSPQRPAWSPDGTKIAYTYSTPASWWYGTPATWDIHVIGATTGAELGHPASAAYEDEYAPSWSPDSTKIAYADKSYAAAAGANAYGIFTMSTDGSGKTRLAGLKLDYADGPDWSPDGKRIAYMGNSATLQVVNSDGSDSHAIAAAGTKVAPAWSPDGTRILSVSTADSKLYVMNPDGSGATALAEGGDATWQPTSVRMLDCLTAVPRTG